MEINRETGSGGPVITGFSGTGFKVRDAFFPRGLLIDPVAVRNWTPPARIDDLAIDDLSDVLAMDPPPEFILIGTGARLVQPPRALVSALEARGIGVEAMDSRAAARAWSVLRNEGRQIAGALFPLA